MVRLRGRREGRQLGFARWAAAVVLSAMAMWGLSAAVAAAATHIYIDQAKGTNGSAVAGTEADPFKSITYAMLAMENRSAPDPWVVHVKAGTYDADPAKPANEREIFPIMLRNGMTIQGEDDAENCILSGAFNEDSLVTILRGENLSIAMLSDLTFRDMIRIGSQELGGACELINCSAVFQHCIFINNKNDNHSYLHANDIAITNGKLDVNRCTFIGTGYRFALLYHANSGGNISENVFNNTGVQMNEGFTGNVVGNIFNNRGDGGPALYLYSGGGNSCNVSGDISYNTFNNSNGIYISCIFKGKITSNFFNSILDIGNFQRGSINFYEGSSGGDVKDVIISNNFFLHNNIGLYSHRNVTVFNNSFYGGLPEKPSINFYQDASDSVVKNNIFSNVGTAIWEQGELDLEITANDFHNVTDILNRNNQPLGDDPAYIDLLLPNFSNNHDWSPNYVGEGLELGQWTANPQYNRHENHTMLTDGNKNWETNQWKGAVLDCGDNANFPILGNSASAIFIMGDLSSEDFLVPGWSYAIDDYRLNENSQNIDAGSFTPLVTTDFEGQPRPMGQAFDIGADEYAETSLIELAPLWLELDEPSGAATFNIRLTAQPASKVTVGLTPSDTTQCDAPPEVVLTSDNWQAGIEVTVTALNDHVIDGTQTVTIQTEPAASDDPAFSGVDALDVQVMINDANRSAVVAKPLSLTVTEPEGAADFNVRLSSRPTADVVIGLSNPKPDQCSVPASVTIAPDEWETGKNVSVTAVDDDRVDGWQTVVIGLGAVASDDATYNGFDPMDVTVSVGDDDAPGVRIEPIELTVAEPDGSSAFNVRLTTQPAADVVVSFYKTHYGACELSHAFVTLTPNNWADGVDVTVSAVDDDLVDGDQTCNILTPAANSADPDYDDIDPPDATVTVTDDDRPPLVIESVTPTYGDIDEPLSVTIRGAGFDDATAVYLLPQYEENGVTKADETNKTAILPLTLVDETEMAGTIPAQSTIGHYAILADNGNHSDLLLSAVTFDDPEIIAAVGRQKAVIVAGGGPYRGNALWTATRQCAHKAYQSLIFQGYAHDNIQYLSPESFFDMDGDGDSEVDGAAAKSTLSHAVKEWAKPTETDPTDDLLIYLTGHGGNGTFQLSNNETLKASELDGWIDALQETLEGRVIVIYDACMSGTFLSQLTPPDGMPDRRICLTSTQSDERAWFLEDGAFSFSWHFWDAVFSNGKLYHAFVAGQTMMAADQTARVDVDGDGENNEITEALLNNDIRIGRGRVAASLPPAIGSVSDEADLTCETSVTLECDDITTLNGISQVWARIVPPQQTDPDAAEPVLYLPTVRLTDRDGDGRYEAQYDDFTRNGGYRISIYARDKSGYESIPVQTQVARSCMGDIDGDGDVTLKDAMTVLKILAGMETGATIVTNYSESGQDVNGDGTAGLAEAIYVLHYVASE